MILEVILFLIFFLLMYIYWNQDCPDYPPGPMRIPIIGGGQPGNDDRCVKLQKKYGDIILEKIGAFYLLTICDYKLCKEAASKSEVANRPQFEVLKDPEIGASLGVSAVNGEHWKSNRRFVLHYLRDCGMGKSSLEDSIVVEAKEIVAEFNRRVGSSSSITFLNFASLNIIWKMVASKRYKVGDPMLDKVQRLNQEFMESLGTVFIFEFIPILKKIIPSFLANYIMKTDACENYSNELKKISQSLIEEHEMNLDPNNPKDLMDLYSLEKESPKHLKPEYMSNNDLRTITTDLFNAGSDTVSITLRWAILYLTKYPHVQTKMQKEIDSVVPREQLPGYEYKTRLPYCEAVIHEILRKSSLANFMIRKNSEEIFLGGYRIPKNTVITGALSFIHHDPRYWKNPQEFNPERFINENGKFICPKEGFLPFGSGKRQCIGEGLARAEIYIFLTAIVQNFTFSPSNGKEVDLRVTTNGLGLHIPFDQEVRVDARK